MNVVSGLDKSPPSSVCSNAACNSHLVWRDGTPYVYEAYHGGAHASSTTEECMPYGKTFFDDWPCTPLFAPICQKFI